MKGQRQGAGQVGLPGQGESYSVRYVIKGQIAEVSAAGDPDLTLARFWPLHQKEVELQMESGDRLRGVFRFHPSGRGRGQSATILLNELPAD